MPPSKDRKRTKLDSVDEIRPKDKAELELEALVFGGDDNAQVERIWKRVGHELSDDADDDPEPGDAEGEEEDMEERAAENDGVSNACNALVTIYLHLHAFDGLSQLFFLDFGPTPLANADPNDAQQDQDPDDDGEFSETRSSDEDDDATRERARKKQQKFEKERYGKPAAWRDDDDVTLRVSLMAEKRLRKLRDDEAEDTISGVEYEQRLRRQFEKIHPVPTWCKLPSQTKSRKRPNRGTDSDYSDEEEQRSGPEEDEDATLLRNTLGILRKDQRGRLLPQGEIEMTRLKNANQMGYSQSAVTSLSFHPNAQVLLTSGLDKTLRLFQIDGKLNPKVQSVYLSDMPVHSSAFDPTGTTILATGRRKYFYIYDVQAGHVDKSQGIYGRENKSLEKFSMSPCGRYVAFLGRDGYIVLVSYKTKQWVANLKMNNSVRSVAWAQDGESLWSVGGDAEVYQWDLRNSRQCIKRWADDGGFKPCALAVSGNEEYYAVG
ncbi:WD40-repeat-containing domain protein [Jimgerdemannia flammicorona]|uniref:WD40-repeat-containing domain protein n=1 Tax=Jimgerdemannia flammicorona TaxID=994334 RepID=A0A433Q5F1_9FUNG|nr:WD40-repeat-containing domain protein [Jimgerdemannia flammicorona]